MLPRNHKPSALPLSVTQCCHRRLLPKKLNIFTLNKMITVSVITLKPFYVMFIFLFCGMSFIDHVKATVKAAVIDN